MVMSSSFLMNSSPAAYPTASVMDHKPFSSVMMDPLSLDYGGMSSNNLSNNIVSNQQSNSLHHSHHHHNSHHHSHHHPVHHQNSSYSLSDYYGTNSAATSNAIQSALGGAAVAAAAQQLGPMGQIGGLVGQHHHAAAAAAAAAHHLSTHGPPPGPSSLSSHHQPSTHPSINSHHPYSYAHLNYAIDQNPVHHPHHPHHSSHLTHGNPYGNGTLGSSAHSMSTLSNMNSMTNSIPSLANNGGGGIGVGSNSLAQQNSQYFSPCSLGSPNGSTGTGGGLSSLHNPLQNSGSTPTVNHISPTSNQLQQQHSPLSNNTNNLSSSAGHLSSRVSSPSLCGQRSPPCSPPSSRNQSLGLLIDPPSPLDDCALSTASGSDSGTGNGSSGGHPVIYPWMKKVHITPGKGGKYITLHTETNHTEYKECLIDLIFFRFISIQSKKKKKFSA